MSRAFASLVVVLSLVAALLTQATFRPNAVEASPTDSIVFLVDVSGSMSGLPLEQAKQALDVGVSALPASTAAGLRAYEGSCTSDGQLLVPITTDNRGDLREAIQSLVAGGGTPTPQALRAAAGDLPTSGSRTVVLVSDGASTCGDPCPVARDIADQLGIDFRVHTVGFRASSNAENELACIAEVTGGEYFSADDADSLGDALSGIVSSTPKNVVVMGDSFSSGEGTYDYDLDSICHRSSKAWGDWVEIFSNGAVKSVKNLACSGAKTSDFFQRQTDRGGSKAQPQLDQLRTYDSILRQRGEQTDIVMLTIGGNDVGFFLTMLSCASSGPVPGMSNCDKSVANSATRNADKIYDRLVHVNGGVIPSIREVVGPDAEIVVVGYPRLFPSSQEDTTGCGWLSDAERRELNRAVSAISARQAWAAVDTGAHFISSLDALDGKEMCSGSDSAFNNILRAGRGLRDPEQAHPDVEGYMLWGRFILDDLQELGLIR
jgi:lysophospholipase L1-like esterase